MQDSSFKTGPDTMNPSGNCTVASMSGYRISPRSGRRHYFLHPFPEFISPYAHRGIFCNGGSSLTTGRRDSIICNRLLKLSDENGEEEGPLTRTRFPDNPYISFIHAMNLLIKSEF